MSIRSEVIRILNEVLSNSKKISELPVAGTITGSELVEVVQDGENKQTTTSSFGGGGGGSGTVTSVALSMPVSVFSVAGSPVTTSGTFAVTFAPQSANGVFAGPTGGGAATPAFRSLVAADIPSLDYVPTSRAIDINGSNQDLSLDRAWRTGMADTGALTYTGISVASGTTVNIGAVTGIIVDNETTPGVPVYTSVSYAGASGVTVPTLGTGIGTYVLLNSSSTIVFQNTFPTSAQRKTMIYLSKIGHPSGTIITAGDETDFVTSPLAQFRDFFQVVKYVNMGVYPSANGVNLNINTSAGTVTGNGINFVSDRTNPNTLSVAATSPTTFFIRTQTGSGGGSTTAITPGNYDVAGTVTAIPGGANTSTIQYIFLVPGLGFIVQLGQTTYSSLNTAIQNIGKENSFVLYPNLLHNAILIGGIALTKSATDLSNTSEAFFFRADIFGQLIGTSVGTSVSTMQQTYNNSGAVDPHILTSTAFDGIKIRRGSAADTDNILVGQNGVGSTTFSLNGNGAITTGIWNGTRLTSAYTPQGSGLSVWGVTGSSTADQASIAAGSDHNILRRSGSAIGFGSIDLSQSGAVGSSILPVANGGTGSATAPWYSLASGGTATGTNTFAFGSNPWIVTSSVTTGTGATAGMQFVVNSLTTGNGFDGSTSSVTSGSLFALSSTSTAINHTAGTSGLVKITSSGANANASRTSIGLTSNVTNTGTTSTNIAAYFSASGASTNYGLFVSSNSTIADGLGVTGSTLTFLKSGESNTTLAKFTSGNGLYTAAQMMVGTGVTFGTDGTSSTTAPSIVHQGRNLTYNVRPLQTAGVAHQFKTTGANFNTGGSNTGMISAVYSIVATSGTGATFWAYSSNPTFDLTSTAGITHYGFYHNPTNTNTTGLVNVAFGHTSGFVQWDSALSPSQITSNQNDYNPTGWNNGGAPNGASILRLNTDASRDLTSLTGGISGRLVIIANVGSQNLVIKNDDGSTGTAANRFALNADITLLPGQSLMCWYDNTSSRWRANKN